MRRNSEANSLNQPHTGSLSLEHMLLLAATLLLASAALPLFYQALSGYLTNFQEQPNERRTHDGERHT